MTPLEIESKQFAGNVGVCWHEIKRIGDTNIQLIAREGEKVCTICHVLNPLNLTYTIELIRAELERVGKWEGLVEYLNEQPSAPFYSTVLVKKAIQISYFDTADILTTPLLLLQAANAYMEV